MKDEMKNTSDRLEVDEIDLDVVAGGIYVDGEPINYRCGFCGQTSLYHCKADIIAHVRSCPKNPNNF